MKVLSPQSVIFPLLLVFTQHAAADEDIGLCCLCEGCGPVVSLRQHFFVDKERTTCNDVYLTMADPQNNYYPGGMNCKKFQQQHRRTCCDPKYDPLPISQSPTRAPEIGDEPPCDICRGGSFPSKPYSVIRMLDRFLEGEHTCEELYHLGITGYLKDQICKPLRLYAKKPCGCEDGGDKGDDTDSLTVSPTSQPRTYAPTKPPTSQPTRKPTRSPTELPTRTPTSIPTPSPTKLPTGSPTRKPTGNSTRNPTIEPTNPPTASSTPSPNRTPTRAPVSHPLPVKVPTASIGTTPPVLHIPPKKTLPRDSSKRETSKLSHGMLNGPNSPGLRGGLHRKS